MSEDIWKIIPKKKNRGSLLLKFRKRKNKREGKLVLHIPLYLRKKSEYFTGGKLIHCNLLERGSLIMIQFIPKEAMQENSRIIHSSQLYLALRDFKLFMSPTNGQRTVRVPYCLKEGNIIIDRRDLRDLKEVSKSPSARDKMHYKRRQL